MSKELEFFLWYVLSLVVGGLLVWLLPLVLRARKDGRGFRVRDDYGNWL